MSSDGYTGLHGRSPFEASRHVSNADAERSHYVPEHWEDLNRGICPACGRTVAWNAERERWERDDSLTILVLTEAELAHLRRDALYVEDLEPLIDMMAELNRPYAESGADA